MSDNKVKITCFNNGPARVEGSFTLVMPDGTEKQVDGPLAICRCGMSANMPFCNGAHKSCVPMHDDRVAKE